MSDDESADGGVADDLSDLMNDGDGGEDSGGGSGGESGDDGDSGGSGGGDDDLPDPLDSEGGSRKDKDKDKDEDGDDYGEDEEKDDDGEDGGDGGDEKDGDGDFTVDGKKFTRAQLESIVKERASFSRKQRAAAATSKRAKSATLELSEARKINDNLRSQVAKWLESSKVNVDLDPRDPGIAEMNPAEVAARYQQAQARNAQIDQMVGQLDQFSAAAAPVSFDDSSKKKGLKMGYEMVVSASLEDDGFDRYVGESEFRGLVSDGMKLFQEYGLTGEEAMASLVVSPTPFAFKMVKDLLELKRLKSKRSGDATKAKSKAKLSSNRKSTKEGGRRHKGPAQSDEAYYARVKYLDALEEKGRKISAEARDQYINFGVPLGARRRS